jgi:hypothetical protein
MLLGHVLPVLQASAHHATVLGNADKGTKGTNDTALQRRRRSEREVCGPTHSPEKVVTRAWLLIHTKVKVPGGQEVLLPRNALGTVPSNVHEQLLALIFRQVPAPNILYKLLLRHAASRCPAIVYLVECVKAPAQKVLDGMT